MTMKAAPKSAFAILADDRRRGMVRVARVDIEIFWDGMGAAVFDRSDGTSYILPIACLASRKTVGEKLRAFRLRLLEKLSAPAPAEPVEDAPLPAEAATEEDDAGAEAPPPPDNAWYREGQYA